MNNSSEKHAKLDIHADDYALSIHNSERFLELMRGGYLDSISVIPNMSSFPECMEMLRKEWPLLEKKPLIAVHLNVAGGYSLAGITDPFLTKKVGTGRVFSVSWGQLFLSSMGFASGGNASYTVRICLTNSFVKAVCTALRLPGI